MQGKAKLVREVGNWVSGDRFWDREQELWDLKELLDEGANVLIAAPRRVGKTSVMRQLHQELEKGNYRCLFIDLEKAQSAEDAIVEVSVATRPHQTLWDRTKEDAAITLARDNASIADAVGPAEKVQDILRQVMDVLKHDGYLINNDAGAFVFASRLLRDWWKGRFEFEFVPATARAKR
jgi:hypothetical protein